MKVRSALERIYLLNATVLITHEIDSAYWHEWELFGMPGGIQIFLVLNLVLVGVVMYGHQALHFGRRSGLQISWMLAMGGLSAAIVHSVFILNDSTAFLNLTSVALLAGTFLLSVLQVALLIKERVGE